MGHEHAHLALSEDARCYVTRSTCSRYEAAAQAAARDLAEATGEPSIVVVAEYHPDILAAYVATGPAPENTTGPSA